jgi:hypothetical protein
MITFIIMFTDYNLKLRSYEVMYMDTPNNLHIYTYHKMVSIYLTFYMLRQTKI